MDDAVRMRMQVRIVGLAALLLLAAGAAGQEVSSDPAAAAVRARIDKLLRPQAKKSKIAVFARELGGPVWVSELADQPLKPASVMKLFTTAAALEKFGPQFRYRTQVWVKDGELMVIGAGDPSLGDERFARLLNRPLHWEFDDWATRLKAGGVQSLRTIALDDHIFDRQTRHPEWDAGQAAEWYQAPVGGLNFNDNCLDARVNVNQGEISLALVPPLPPSFVRNAVRVGPKHAPFGRREGDQDIFELGGTVTKNADISPIACGNPTVFFGHALATMLAQRGVTLSGDVVRRDVTPAMLEGARLVATVETPLRDVMWRANTHSQNMFAEALMKSLPAYQPDGTPSGTPGNWAGGASELRAAIGRLGVDLRGAEIRDGSGLGHGNRVTARQVVELLRAIDRHPHGDLYMQTLAEPGEEGSMRRRYADKVLVGRLRAKTGTISGVSTLAGVLTRSDGREIAFAVLINGAGSSELIRQICVAMAN